MRKKSKSNITTETTNTTASKIQNIAEFGSGISMIAGAVTAITTSVMSVYSMIHNRKLNDAMHHADTMYVQAKLAVMSYKRSDSNEKTEEFANSIDSELEFVINRIRKTKNYGEIQKAIKYFTNVYDHYKPIESFDDHTVDNIFMTEEE